MTSSLISSIAGALSGLRELCLGSIARGSRVSTPVLLLKSGWVTSVGLAMLIPATAAHGGVPVLRGPAGGAGGKVSASNSGQSARQRDGLAGIVSTGQTSIKSRSPGRVRLQRPETGPTLVFSKFKPGQPLRLIAYGDMRFTDPSITDGTNPRVRKWLVDKIAQENPQALLITGDMPMTGEKQSDWDWYQKETAPWTAAAFPVFPTMGNHEVYHNKAKGTANFLANYPLLKGHTYYSALLGSVEVISLDMNTSISLRSEQARWFVGQLDHLPPQVDFLIILYHIPPVVDTQSKLVASLPTPDARTLRSLLESRLPHLRPRVLVLNGHIHNYERFEERGVEYVVTGGGGAVPYPVLFRGIHDLYRDPEFPVYHYLTLEVSGQMLKAAMWKIKDPKAETLEVEQKDSFQIVQSVSAPTAKANKPATPSNP